MGESPGNPHTHTHKQTNRGVEQWGTILGNGRLKAIVKAGFVLILQAVVEGRVVGYPHACQRGVGLNRGSNERLRPRAALSH